MEMQTKDLKLAQIRFYEKGKGAEVLRDKAYVFLLKKGDHYVNPLNPGTELPVYKRTLYSRTRYDGSSANGEDYGTLLELEAGEEKTGPCYVFEHFHDDGIFPESTITMRQLEAYVMNSDYFFMDSPEIFQRAILDYKAGNSEFRQRLERLFPGKQLKTLNQKYAEAVAKKDKFEAYLRSCGVEEKHFK